MEYANAGLFKSPHKNLTVNVRKPVMERHPASGDIIGVKSRRLSAEFGVQGGSSMVLDPVSGQNIEVAELWGGFFDSAAVADHLGWTEDEHDAVVATLRYKCSVLPGMIQEVKALHVPAPLPWPTFTQSDAAEAVELAGRLKLVPETLRYERENLRRAVVLEALEEAILLLDPDDQSRAETQEAIPAGSFDEKSHGVPLGTAPQINKDGAVIGSGGLTDNVAVNPSRIDL